MQFIPIKTRPLHPPCDDLFDVLDSYVTNLHEWDVICITSKIVAIHQGRCIPCDQSSKADLIQQEAEAWVTTDVVPWKHIYLTITDGILIPSAGIDESNANGHYILRPHQVSMFVKQLYDYFRIKHNITNVWVILTVSMIRPLKWWVVWIWIYSYGIVPLLDKRWCHDIFWKSLAITQINVIDSLSAMAVYLMGEADECQPIVIGRDILGLVCTDVDVYPTTKIPIEHDLYTCLLKPFMKDFNGHDICV